MNCLCAIWSIHFHSYVLSNLFVLAMYFHTISNTCTNLFSFSLFKLLRNIKDCTSIVLNVLKKNTIASGRCTCGKIEITAHCLLDWPNYIFIRNETIQTLGTIDVQSLIFGNSLKRENENRLVHVFEIV
jgi:hypothetical protein